MTESRYDGAGSTGQQQARSAADRLSQDTAALLRAEIERVRDEMTGALRRAGLGTAALAGAGVCGVLALWSAHEALLRSLEKVLPPPRAAAVLTVAYGAKGAALAWFGRSKLRGAGRASHEALERVRP